MGKSGVEMGRPRWRGPAATLPVHANSSKVGQSTEDEDSEEEYLAACAQFRVMRESKQGPPSAGPPPAGQTVPPGPAAPAATPALPPPPVPHLSFEIANTFLMHEREPDEKGQLVRRSCQLSARDLASVMLGSVLDGHKGITCPLCQKLTKTFMTLSISQHAPGVIVAREWSWDRMEAARGFCVSAGGFEIRPMEQAEPREHLGILTFSPYVADMNRTGVVTKLFMNEGPFAALLPTIRGPATEGA